jgi:C-glycoside oxidase
VSQAIDRVDVVVVGSGPAGTTYARLIGDLVPEARVLVVDSGPVVSEPPGTHVNTIEDPGARARAKIASQGPAQYSYDIPLAEQRLLSHRTGQDGPILPHEGLFLLSATQDASPDFPAAAMASNVGGMGAHWFGACPRPYGTERIGFLDGPVLDGALATAERLLGVSAGQFAGSDRAAWRESLLGDLFNAGREPARWVQPMPLAVNRERPGSGQAGPAVILGPLLGSALDGGHGHLELRPETLCRRVIMDGDRATGVELVDLATGTPYQTAARQVVVAADSLRTPQLLYASGVRPAALGRHLAEHPYVAAIVAVDGVFDEPSDPAIDALMPSSGVTWIPFDEARFPLHAQVSQRSSVLTIGLFLRKEIRPENRVEFSDAARDWQDLPRMEVHYSLSDLDRTVVDQALQVAADITTACGGTSAPGWPRLMPGGSSLHYQGTVRMGPADDGQSVCDRHGRVWGTQNLFVAGNGLIPTSTACNPTLTSVALAVLGAREVSAQLDPGSGRSEDAPATATGLRPAGRGLRTSRHGRLRCLAWPRPLPPARPPSRVPPAVFPSACWLVSPFSA